MKTGALILIVLALVVFRLLPFKTFVVQSGSMEPTIKVGDVILVKNTAEFGINDVVTFREPDGRMVTHRVMEIRPDGSIITKGDANKDADRGVIGRHQVVGLVSGIIPKAGYVANFAKTLPGLLLMIFVPAVLLVLSELRIIFGGRTDKG